jgi:thymidylate synthase
MKPYLDLLRNVLENGETRGDRTGTGTLSIFGTQSRYDLRDGFPLVTTKRVPFRNVVKELLWFLSGSTNTRDLGCSIWDPWADENGNLGPIYSAQWRNWGGVDMGRPVTQGAPFGIDQITQVIEGIKKNPEGRRHIVSAWNVEDLDAMRLPPCHVMHQYYVSGIGSATPYLDMQMYQRSADLPVGVPFNVASYALLLTMVAQECGLTPRYLVHTIGDAHIYLNQVEGVEEQLRRSPKPLPRIVVAKKPVLDVRLEDVQLLDYDPHPAIKYEVAV